MNSPSLESQNNVETLTGTKKALNGILGLINTLNSDIENRMVNGTQANTTADWHDAWGNLAPGIVMQLQMMVMKDGGELTEEDKKFFSDKADELLNTIRSVDAHNRTDGEPKLQKIVGEIKAQIEEMQKYK